MKHIESRLKSPPQDNGRKSNGETTITGSDSDNNCTDGNKRILITIGKMEENTEKAEERQCCTKSSPGQKKHI
jgi:hypothetical protein